MGPEQGSSLLVEGHCTQDRLQLVPAAPGVLSVGATPTRPSQAVAAQPLMCESGDHVTLSRRCLVRVYSPDLACLPKVVALRAASSSHLLHEGCCRNDHGASPLTGGGSPAPDV